MRLAAIAVAVALALPAAAQVGTQNNSTDPGASLSGGVAGSDTVPGGSSLGEGVGDYRPEGLSSERGTDLSTQRRDQISEADQSYDASALKQDSSGQEPFGPKLDPLAD